MRRPLAATLLCGIFAVMTGTSARADVIGSIYENDSTGASDATPANVPTTTPDVTFTAPTPLDFTSGSAYTIGEFLASGNGSTVLTGNSQLGNTLDNTIFNFTGTVTVTHGETFTAGHDDGLTLTIGGATVISTPGPTAFAVTTETYNGPSGNEPFQLVYGECCGAPGDLSISLPFVSPVSVPVPEPASAAVLASGIAGAAVLLRRRRPAATMPG